MEAKKRLTTQQGRNGQQQRQQHPQRHAHEMRGSHKSDSDAARSPSALTVMLSLEEPAKLRAVSLVVKRAWRMQARASTEVIMVNRSLDRSLATKLCLQQEQPSSL
jgi:hypothetical protein